MEKKYIGEHLKGREWIKDLFDWIADGADTEYWLKRKYQTDNTLLVKDLEQLLDKAREEGFADGVELEQLLNAEFFGEDYQNPKRLKELKKKYNFEDNK